VFQGRVKLLSITDQLSLCRLIEHVLNTKEAMGNGELVGDRTGLDRIPIQKRPQLAATGCLVTAGLHEFGKSARSHAVAHGDADGVREMTQGLFGPGRFGDDSGGATGTRLGQETQSGQHRQAGLQHRTGLMVLVPQHHAQQFRS